MKTYMALLALETVASTCDVSRRKIIHEAVGIIKEQCMAPISMILFCPACDWQHIDEACEGWDNPPHRSHLCNHCGHVWRPADVPTVGVKSINTRGERDTQPTAKQARKVWHCKRVLEDDGFEYANLFDLQNDLAPEGNYVRID